MKREAAGWRTVFDILACKEQVIVLEKEMSAPDFWNNQAHARKIAEELAHLKKQISFWESFLSDVGALRELIVVSRNQGKEEDFENEVLRLEHELREAEQEMYLSGPYDNRDLLLTIYAGAGGEDAEDWVRILAEMYERYAKKHNMRVALVHEHKNEQKGFKNITLAIEGKNV